MAVRLRATARVEGGGAAQLLLRVDRVSGELGFFDDMAERAIRSGAWTTYEVIGDTALGLWLAAQKFPYDAVVGR